MYTLYADRSKHAYKYRCINTYDRCKSKFSKVVRLVDEQGAVVILKNNKPRYAVISFSEYDGFLEYQKSMNNQTAD